MKIYHFSNSFIKVVTLDSVLVCDPWVGSGNHGGWHSTPEYDRQELINEMADASHVYISHLHSDHFDPEFLVESGLIKKVLVIKKFGYPTMRKRLELLGADKVIEIDGLTDFNLSAETRITIVPQMSSNSAGEDDPVNFDLDTSIIVHDNTCTFFNQVDNPLSASDFSVVADYIQNTYGNLDIACYACGAASEYPQCFVNIDRMREKKKIVRNSLDKLSECLSSMSPTYFFMAGGAYFIPGKFHRLNAFIAQPELSEVRMIEMYKSKFLEPQGGQEIDINKEKVSIDSYLLPTTNDAQTSIENHKSDIYQYEDISLPSQEDILQLFNAAHINYSKKLDQLKITLRRKIIFRVQKSLEIDEYLQVVSNELQCLEVNSDFLGQQVLVIHIDARALWGCLTRKLIWNQVLSGSLCMYERSPNEYEPETLFGLNFLVA